jgi:hypothetical protein
MKLSFRHLPLANNLYWKQNSIEMAETTALVLGQTHQIDQIPQSLLISQQQQQPIPCCPHSLRHVFKPIQASISTLPIPSSHALLFKTSSSYN